MLRSDKSALVCDMAETYGITDCRNLPLSLLATLAAGLGEESRSKTKLSSRKATKTELMLAAIVDGLNRITWLLSAVCPHDGEMPKSVLKSILGEDEKKNDGEAMVFASPEKYEREWERITGVSHGEK